MTAKSKKTHAPRPKAQLVPIEKIKVPRRLQRQLNKKIVQEIDDNFDESRLGVIDGVQRDSYWIISDGQHRHFVCRRRGITHMWLNPEPPMPDEDIAALILQKNLTRASINSADRYKLGHTSQDPLYLETQDIVVACGFKTIVNQHSKGQMIYAVARLVSLHKQGILMDVLSTVVAAWPEDPTGPQAHMLSGLGRMINSCNWSEIDQTRLINKLSSMTPDQLVSRAKVRAESEGVNLDKGLAMAVCSMYNSGKGRGRALRTKGRMLLDFTG